MRSFLPILATLVTAATAQSSWFDAQSNPFRLVLKSDNETYNGHVLGACHEGAALEGLCLTDSTLNDTVSPYYTFYHNISTANSNSSDANANNTLGILTYTLRANGNLSVPSSMTFAHNPGSNLADLIIRPGADDAQSVAFDECGKMYVEVYQNDTASPPAYYDPPLKLMNWFVCLTRYSYLYTTLTFKVGVTGEPQNPSCVAVEVIRAWTG